MDVEKWGIYPVVYVVMLKDMSLCVTLHVCVLEE